jgi:hypothetical protein
MWREVSLHSALFQAASSKRAGIVGQSLFEMRVLLGDTGLVGSVLQQSTRFDATFNSSNLRQLLELPEPIDELYLCCLPATKWLVNQQPRKDFNNVLSIVDVLAEIDARKVILISTIDVYEHTPPGADEECWPIYGRLGYGTNRLLFENLVQDSLGYDTCVVRLPAVFHPLIKKNVLFDLLNDSNVDQINANSAYQWYPLKRLWRDLQAVRGEEVVNLFPPPIETMEIMDKFFPNAPVSMGKRIEYDYRTTISETGYWLSKGQVMDDLEVFINEARR